MMSWGPGLAFGAGGLRSRACALRTSLGSSPCFASFSHSSSFRLSFLALGTWCARMLRTGRVTTGKVIVEHSEPLPPWAVLAAPQPFSCLPQHSLLVNWLSTEPHTHYCTWICTFRTPDLPRLHLRAAGPTSLSSPRAEAKPISRMSSTFSTPQPLFGSGSSAALTPGLNPLSHSPETQLYSSLLSQCLHHSTSLQSSGARTGRTHSLGAGILE